MLPTHPVTIYTTHPTFGNIVRYQGALQAYGGEPSEDRPTAAYVRFVPLGKRRPREILQTVDPYILIIEGHDGILTPDMFAVSATLTGLTHQQGPVCFDPHYRARFNRLIQPMIDNGWTRVVADFRTTGPGTILWSVRRSPKTGGQPLLAEHRG